MLDYKAPLRDMRFVRNQLLDYPAHYTTLDNGEEASPDIVDAVLEEGARFCEQVLAPLNAVGDAQGCQWSDEGVTTPEGFKQAYAQYIAGGWPALAHSPEFDGQGLPESLDFAINEMTSQANWAWAMYPFLSHGAIHTLFQHGSAAQKAAFLPSLVSGQWTGTMCLTESHCGSDLGMMRTRAEPLQDDAYRINGTKIFISSGEHDMAENIVHIVLARLPDAPEGTRGISLFIVPKFLPKAGQLGARNGVHCGSLEHKMGIHGNATCVLNFDDATGYLLGEANKGLQAMFTFMNGARLGTALQGLGHCERAWQGALPYAKDRLQMRSLSGVKNPDGPADPIIVHPDVRRMLLTIKAFTEGSRALFYYTARLSDTVMHGKDEAERTEADTLLSFLTPIAKAFITEVSNECANLGMQVYGGHGYVKEWGMEQNVRDARIATIYEGTTGIQALDLLGRKVLMTQGETLKRFTGVIYQFCKQHENTPHMQPWVTPLRALNKQWGKEVTLPVGMRASQNRDEVGAAAYDYLMYSGYIALAYFWADMARLAHEQLAAGTEETDFYQGKIETAHFYYQRILPRAELHKTVLLSGAASLMTITAEQLGE